VLGVKRIIEIFILNSLSEAGATESHTRARARCLVYSDRAIGRVYIHTRPTRAMII
jgi:hypothetical protein